MITAVYVGNLLLMTATKGDEKQALEDIRPSFPIKNLGEVSNYLGCDIIRDRKARPVTFSQLQYARPWSTF